MISARLATEEDRFAIFALGREYAAEVKDAMPGVRFENRRANEVFDEYLAGAHPTIFVAEQDGKVIGFLIATLQPFLFMAGLWTNVDLLFVTPVKRGTRAAAELLAHFDKWSDEIGAKMSMGGNSNKLHTARTASLYSRYGFEIAGMAMMKFRRD